MIDAGDIARAIQALIEEQRNLPGSVFRHVNTVRLHEDLLDGNVFSAEVVLEHGHSQALYYKVRVAPCTQGEVYGA